MDSTENITFPHLRWQAVKIVISVHIFPTNLLHIGESHQSSMSIGNIAVISILLSTLFDNLIRSDKYIKFVFCEQEMQVSLHC